MWSSAQARAGFCTDSTATGTEQWKDGRMQAWGHAEGGLDALSQLGLLSMKGSEASAVKEGGRRRGRAEEKDGMEGSSRRVGERTATQAHLRLAPRTKVRPVQKAVCLLQPRSAVWAQVWSGLRSATPQAQHFAKHTQ